MEATVKLTRAQEFRAALAERPLLADGAMATQLHARRPTLLGAVEDTNLTLAPLVRNVYRDYLAAGAEILKTNTFGANRLRLESAGSHHRAVELNRSAVRIAREASRDRAFVAGVIGPLGARLAPLGPLPAAEAHAAFIEQAAALFSAGVDLFVLETFRDIAELRVAIDAVRAVAGDELVIAAQVTVGDDGRLYDGTPVEAFGPCLDELRADAVGVNCSGPRALLDALEKLAAMTAKPLIAVPSAGLPTTHNGKMTFPCTPEYMAGYARRYAEAGARIVGGCCGTTPEHIRAMGDAIAGVQPAERSVSATAATRPEPVEPVTLESKSRLGVKLAEREFVTIVELDTPRGDAAQSIAAALQCLDAGIDVISFPSGQYAVGRMSAVAACHLIHGRAHIGTMLYQTCRDRSAAALQGALLGANAMGVHNVLCITGDPPGSIDIDSVGLVEIAHNLNRGQDLGGNPIGAPAELLIGVAANPSAADLDHEVQRFEAKVRAGAEFAITTPIFDAAVLDAFLHRTGHLGIPLFASIWPLASLSHAEFVVNELGQPVPEAVLDRLRAGEDGAALAREIAAAVRPKVAGLRVIATGAEVRTAINVALH